MLKLHQALASLHQRLYICSIINKQTIKKMTATELKLKIEEQKIKVANLEKSFLISPNGKKAKLLSDERVILMDLEDAYNNNAEVWKSKMDDFKNKLKDYADVADKELMYGYLKSTGQDVSIIK